jgi:proline iminopeptidase
MESAVKLHHALPKADYVVLPDAGHIAQGESMIDALVSAADKFVAILKN